MKDAETAAGSSLLYLMVDLVEKYYGRKSLTNSDIGEFEFYTIYRNNLFKCSKSLGIEDFGSLEFPTEKLPAGSKGPKGQKTYTRFWALWKKLYYQNLLKNLKARPEKKAIDGIRKDVEKIFRVDKKKPERYGEIIETDFSFDHDNGFLLGKPAVISKTKNNSDYNFDALLSHISFIIQVFKKQDTSQFQYKSEEFKEGRFSFVFSVENESYKNQKTVEDNWKKSEHIQTENLTIGGEWLIECDSEGCNFVNTYWKDYDVSITCWGCKKDIELKKDIIENPKGDDNAQESNSLLGGRQQGSA